MSALLRAPWLPRLSCLVVAAALSTSLLAADRPKGAGDRIDPADQTVDLLAGIQQGQLEAKLIVKDSSKCRVMIKNLTERPLNVQLPAAFAGVPVMAQFMDRRIIGNDVNNENAPQRVGSGFPPNDWVNNNNNNNNNIFNLPNNPGPNNRRQNPIFGPMFNIAPEKVAQFKLECVCLDHGKPNPKAQIAYEIRPIASVTEKAEVHELCAMLGRGEVEQSAAQAAAWHLTNGMTWEQLKAKKRLLAMGVIQEPYFTRGELDAAKKATQQAEKTVQDREKASPSDSLSQR